MTALSYRDMKDVLLITGVALECRDTDEMRTHVLESFKRVFKAEKGSFFLGRESGEGIDLSNAMISGVDPKAKAEYLQFYHRLDPTNIGLRSAFNVYSIDDIVPFSDLTKSRYYNEFYKPQSILYELVMLFRSGTQLLGLLSVLRPPQGGNFSSHDRAKAEFMVPYMKGILGKNLWLDRLKYRTNILETIAGNLPDTGIIVLNQSFQPIQMDEPAERILSLLSAEGEKKTKPGFFLPPEVYSQCEELLKTAQEQEQAELYERQLILDIPNRVQQLSIRLRLTRPRTESPVFIICLDLKDPIYSLNQRLNTMGLSKREQEVTRLVCEGLENGEISDKLFISSHTVEGHLKSIYRKLGVRNRTSLVHRVMTLA